MNSFSLHSAFFLTYSIFRYHTLLRIFIYLLARSYVDRQWCCSLLFSFQISAVLRMSAIQIIILFFCIFRIFLCIFVFCSFFSLLIWKYATVFLFYVLCVVYNLVFFSYLFLAFLFCLSFSWRSYDAGQ